MVGPIRAELRGSEGGGRQGRRASKRVYLFFSRTTFRVWGPSLVDWLIALFAHSLVHSSSCAFYVYFRVRKNCLRVLSCSVRFQVKNWKKRVLSSLYLRIQQLLASVFFLVCFMLRVQEQESVQGCVL